MKLVKETGGCRVMGMLNESQLKKGTAVTG